MRATIKRMGTKERVASAALESGKVTVDAPFDVAAPLLAFLGAAHVVRWRDERDIFRERKLEAGSDEHFALRLEALPAIGFFADEVSR